MNKINDSLDLIQTGDLHEIEIYNFMESLTGNFDQDKVEIVLKDIELLYRTLLDDIKDESQNIYLQNGWELPKKNITIGGITAEVTDFQLMKNKTHPAEDYSFVTAINILKKKHSNQDNMISKKQIELKRLCSYNSKSDYIETGSSYFAVKLKDAKEVSLRRNSIPISERTFIEMEKEFFNSIYQDLMHTNRVNDITMVQNYLDFLEYQSTKKHNVRKYESYLSDECLISIFDYLTEKGYLRTENKNWLAWFGRNDSKPKNMEWCKSDQALSNIMYLLCKPGTHRPNFDAFGKHVNNQERREKIEKTTYGLVISKRINTELKK